MIYIYMMYTHVTTFINKIIQLLGRILTPSSMLPVPSPSGLSIVCSSEAKGCQSKTEPGLWLS